MADFTKDEVLALIERCDREARVTEAESRRPMEFNARHNIDLHIRNCNIVATALRALAKSMDAEPVAWLHPTAGWAHADKTVISPHCLNDGSDGGPIPLYASPLVSAQAEPVAVKAPVKWVAAALKALEAYEADLGTKLPDGYELGRIEDSRGSASFRISAGHLRQLAALVSPPAPVAEAGAVVPEDAYLVMRERVSALREGHRRKMNDAGGRAEMAVAAGDMKEASINSTESERHREAFVALNVAVGIIDQVEYATMLATPPPPARQIGEANDG